MNIVLVLIPVALSLLGGKLTRQLILMQFVGIIFVVGLTGFSSAIRWEGSLMP